MTLPNSTSNNNQSSDATLSTHNELQVYYEKS